MIATLLFSITTISNENTRDGIKISANDKRKKLITKEFENKGDEERCIMRDHNLN